MVPAVLWKNRLFLKLHPWSPKITLLIAVICVYVKCAPKNILIAIHQLCQCTHMRSNCYFEEKKLWLLRPAVIICTSYQLIQIDQYSQQQTPLAVHTAISEARHQINNCIFQRRCSSVRAVLSVYLFCHLFHPN